MTDDLNKKLSSIKALADGAREQISQAIADGLNELGYGVEVPNEKGEMRFGPECHECLTIADHVLKLLNGDAK